VTSADAVFPSGSRRQPLGLMLALTLLPLLVLIGVGMGLALGVRGTDVQVLAFALVTGAVALVPLMLEFVRPAQRRHLLLFFLLFAYLVFFVASVFTTYFFEHIFIQRPEPGITDLKGIAPSDIVQGQIVVLVALLAMLAGYAIPLARVVPIPRPRREWSFPSTLVVALITITFGWMIYLSGQYGILPKRVGSGFIGAFSNSTYFGIALLMLSYLRYRSYAALLLMALLIPPTMFFNYFTSSKGLFFAPIAVTMIAFIVVARRIRLRWILAAFVAMALFYPIGEFQRQVILQSNTRGAAWALRRPVEVASKTARFVTHQDLGDMLWTGVASTLVRFDGLGIASVIVRDCPSRVPYQGGWTLAQIPLSFIPRLVWKDKPDMTSGGWVTEKFAGGPGILSSTGSTWVGEFWFNFGWPGVVMGMLVMGIFFRTLHEILFKPPAVIPAQLMAVIVLFAVPPTLGGAVISPVNGVVFGAMPVVLMHFAIRIMSGTLRPVPAGDRESADLAAKAHVGV
jgi:hypothetical protein